MTEKILYSSDKAAKKIKVDAWISSDGIIYPFLDASLDKVYEHQARWCGCTHMICKCGKEHEKGKLHCDDCITKDAKEKYLSMPEKEWDGETPLVIFGTDTYLFDDIETYCLEEGCEPSDLKLCICEPIFATEVDADEFYCDSLPQDMGLDVVSPALSDKFQEIDEYIEKEKIVLSWTQGKYRATFNFING